MADFTPWQWLLLATGAWLIGLSKTGVAGLAALSVAIFANILPARISTGIVLPLLILADLFAVRAYRRHVVWKPFLRVLPWMLAGIAAGHHAMGQMHDVHIQRLIGIILLTMLGLHVWRMSKRNAPTPAVHPWLAPAVGLAAGFCSLVANAAGPVMILYFLTLRLAKMEFMGTMAGSFLLLNLFKVPFSYDLGLIHADTLRLNLLLAPAVIVGALGGRKLLEHINQKWFERITLAGTLVAGLRLVMAHGA